MRNKNKKVNFDLFVNNYNKLLKKKTSFFSSLSSLASLSLPPLSLREGRKRLCASQGTGKGFPRLSPTSQSDGPRGLVADAEGLGPRRWRSRRQEGCDALNG